MAELVNTPPTEVIYLTAGVVSQEYKDFCVKTTDTEIKSYLYRISKRNKTQLKIQFSQVYSNLTKYSNETLTEHYKKNNQEFKDWCDDLAIFCSLRLILFNFPIPIV
jgi:hypothetical protein